METLTHRIWFLWGLTGLLVCLSGCGDAPRIKQVEQAIDRSANYLIACTREDGRFEYCINMDASVEVEEKYNIVRHAGTIYAMCMAYQQDPNPELKAAILRAGRFLQRESLRPIPGRDDLLAVWSEPELDSFSDEREAKLGGTGLGLVALLNIEKIHPGFTPPEVLQALGRFLIYLQKTDGSFYTMYVPTKGGRWDDWVSLYYPGEAALGLVMLYEQDPSPQWLNAAAEALYYLYCIRENRTQIPADHWALLATEKLLLPQNREKLPVPSETLVKHAMQICETMLNEQIQDSSHPDCNGGFVEDGRTTPTATRLEGLQAALTFLPPEHEMHQRVEKAVSLGMAFLLRAQVQDGPYEGAFPRAIGKWEVTDPTIENFNHRATEVRIDYVQHALSAMIQYVRWKNGSALAS